MGNISSLYNNYKTEYKEMEEKYNKLKVKYDSKNIEEEALKKTIEELENDIIKTKIDLDDNINENTINIKQIEGLKAKYDSININNENRIIELIKENEENNDIIETVKNDCVELNNENKIKIKEIEILNNKLKICENVCEEQKKEIEILNTKSKMCENICEERKDKIEKSLELIENQFNENENIKKNMREIIHYYYDNKDIIVSEILAKHNTMLPDYMEKNIIGNIYNYLIEKIDRNINNKLN
tara:strand:+ start:88 stop:816 length:729 start_codon:yes stop_codon:yes gene_type:complete